MIRELVATVSETEYLVGALAERGLTLSCAESCTGGAIASAIVGVSGASRVLRGGVVAYDPAVKSSLLGVCAESISRFGVVSSEVAREMAEGARRVLESDLAVSTTGVAGPLGGTSETPVGRVFIGVSGRFGTKVYRETFEGSRDEIRRAAVDASIRHLLEYLQDYQVL